MSKANPSFVAIGVVAAVSAIALAGCGTSNASVDQNRETGVADSGYPPKGEGSDYGSPALKGNAAAGTIDRQADSLPRDVAALPEVSTGTVGTTQVKLLSKRAGTLPPENPVPEAAAPAPKATAKKPAVANPAP